MAYRFYDYQSHGQSNPDGSCCQGIVYRSLDLRSYADQNWLRIQQFKPGCACISSNSLIPVNFFEPHPFMVSK
ncbi:MAG: hypothetical protein WBA13_07120 [Microcoleaceae cyanobacterium]